MAGWTSDDIPDQPGKTALVTGGNSGLGYETVLHLARKGARVLLAARDQPTSVTELAGLMGMTKQAASKLVDAMVSGGYLQRGTDAR